jgi:hypothetical protein
MIVQPILSLDHPKISSSIIGDVRHSLTELFQQIQLNFDGNAVTKIQFEESPKGRSVRLYTNSEKDVPTLLFIPKSKKALRITKPNGYTACVQGDIAASVKLALKHLRWNAQDIKIFTHPEPRPLSPDNPQAKKSLLSHPTIISLYKNSYYLASILRVVSFALGKLNTIAKPTLEIGKIIQAHAHLLGLLSSILTIVSGLVNLVPETRNLIAAVKEYSLSKTISNKSETRINTIKMIYYSIRILAILAQIGLGIAAIACPHFALTILIVTIVIFVILYVPESAISIKLSNQNIKYIDSHYIYYQNGILKNDKLSMEEKENAAAQFIFRVFGSKTNRRDPLEQRDLIREIFSKENIKTETTVTVKGSPTALRTPFALGFLEETQTCEETKKITFSETVSQCFSRFLESQKTMKMLAFCGLQVMN